MIKVIWNKEVTTLTRLQRRPPMGGFHILDLVVIAIIGLALFGPKALQSIARNAGKGVGQAKTAKEKVMAELPLEDLSKVAQKVPMNPQQAIQMLITPEKEKEQD
jgi:Sec-independent protein translocase protein TatA